MSHDTTPFPIVDTLLWRQAQQVAAAHQPDPMHPRRCANLGCMGAPWPCRAHQLATRAAAAARTDPPGLNGR